MSKYDDIWPRAEQVALQLKLLGYTPQQSCTAIAKQFFKDTLVETLPCHLKPEILTYSIQRQVQHSERMARTEVSRRMALYKQ
jgi:hypothetical protein